MGDLETTFGKIGSLLFDDFQKLTSRQEEVIMQVKDILVRLDALEEQQKNSKEKDQIEGAQRDIRELSQRIEGISQSVSNMQTSAESANSLTNKLSYNISNLEERQTNNCGRIETLEKNLNNLNRYLMARVERIEQRSTYLSNQVEDHGVRIEEIYRRQSESTKQSTSRRIPNDSETQLRLYDQRMERRTPRNEDARTEMNKQNEIKIQGRK
jgi:chromosome segregation ATPase